MFCLTPAAHDPGVSLNGSDVGHEHTVAPSAVPSGILHGDWLRLVGCPAPCTARDGPQPCGEVTRGVHETEPSPAAGMMWIRQAIDEGLVKEKFKIILLGCHN